MFVGEQQNLGAFLCRTDTRVQEKQTLVAAKVLWGLRTLVAHCFPCVVRCAELNVKYPRNAQGSWALVSIPGVARHPRRAYLEEDLLDVDRLL